MVAPTYQQLAYTILTSENPTHAIKKAHKVGISRAIQYLSQMATHTALLLEAQPVAEQTLRQLRHLAQVSEDATLYRLAEDLNYYNLTLRAFQQMADPEAAAAKLRDIYAEQIRGGVK